MIARIIYRKPSTGGFITIESVVLSRDSDYLYLECGKYLKKNIISIFEINEPDVHGKEGLVDDA